jgi:hypothetical protein
VLPRVTGKVAVLGTCDPRDLTANTQKARDHGMEIVDELDFCAFDLGRGLQIGRNRRLTPGSGRRMLDVPLEAHRIPVVHARVHRVPLGVAPLGRSWGRVANSELRLVHCADEMGEVPCHRGRLRRG